jgi:glycosyltransferase involved in cell wall biosynthesis
VFVSSHALPGGSERYLELLLGALGPEWVAGVVSLQDGWLVDRLREAGHPVAVVPAGRRLGILPAAVRLRRVLRSRRPQVVHANGVKAALVAALAMTGTGIPVLWVKHDFFWDGPLARCVARLCRQVVGVSAAVVEGLPAERVHVVPNGIAPAPVDRAAGRARLHGLFGLPEGARVVLLLGRLHRVKGAAALVEAAPGVLARAPGVHFGLVGGEDPGEPEVADEVCARVAALSLEGAVRLLGHQDDPQALMAGADVVAIPSGPHAPGLRGEGFGMVAIEAMAAGTPVVGLAAGALPEVVGDAGLLVPPGDPGALADALVRALTDEPLRARLAEAGRRRVADCFTLERMADAMRVRYREARGWPGPRPSPADSPRGPAGRR